MTSSILQAEILEQPDVIHELLQSEKENVQRITEKIKNRFNYVIIAARGTSDNAARYAQYLFGSHNHLQVALATPSLFSLYQAAPKLTGAFVIGISQSGQSPDIVSVLKEARNQGCPTLAITNSAASPLAETADEIILLHADPEQAIAATKSYTASLTALALISCSLSANEKRFHELELVPGLMRQMFLDLQPALTHVERYRFMEHCNVIGRGFNYSTAFEIALKVKELTGIVAEPYSSADFRHGPIATVERGFPVILIAPSGFVYSDLSQLVEQLIRRKAELLVISDQADLLEKANLPLPIPTGIPEWISPLLAVVPGQLFALRLTLEKGMDPDNPEGLTKVTVTL